MTILFHALQCNSRKLDQANLSGIELKRISRRCILQMKGSKWCAALCGCFERVRLVDLVRIEGRSDVRTLFYPAITSAGCGW
jgi:hypothetical protein